MPCTVLSSAPSGMGMSVMLLLRPLLLRPVIVMVPSTSMGEEETQQGCRIAAFCAARCSSCSFWQAACRTLPVAGWRATSAAHSLACASMKASSALTSRLRRDGGRGRCRPLCCEGLQKGALTLRVLRASTHAHSQAS